MPTDGFERLTEVEGATAFITLIVGGIAVHSFNDNVIGSDYLS